MGLTMNDQKILEKAEQSNVALDANTEVNGEQPKKKAKFGMGQNGQWVDITDAEIVKGE